MECLKIVCRMIFIKPHPVLPLLAVFRGVIERFVPPRLAAKRNSEVAVIQGEVCTALMEVIIRAVKIGR